MALQRRLGDRRLGSFGRAIAEQSATIYTIGDEFDRLTSMIPRTYIFAVAIEDYQDTSFQSVVYAEQDAQDFVAAWQTMGVEPVDCVILLSDQATHAELRSTLLKFLSKVGPEDRLILFYAGHGASIHGASVVSACDTRFDDAEKSSLPLAEILNDMRQAKCSQILLFLDVCHGSITSASGDTPELETEFTGDDLRAFCKESASRFAFVSCKSNQISFSSRSLNHGIWTHCLIQAIKGDAKESIGKDRRVTTTSLQNYLLTEVPRILRVTVAGAVKQTPVLFGSKTKELVLMDLAELLQKGHLAAGAAINPIQDSCLTGEIRGRVRELRGYTKPKTPLAMHNDWERDFVEKAGSGEVSAHATEIFEQLRESFRYKRKDLSFTNIASTASIKGPDFDVNISLSQDPDDAEKYLLTTEVRSFRNSTVIDDPNFLAIFTKYCKRIVFELDANLDLESKIDDIEENDALAAHLDYDPECTEFTLRLPEPGIVIYATGDRMVFSLDSQGDLKLLLGNTQKAFTQLAGNSINLGLRSSKP